MQLCMNDMVLFFWREAMVFSRKSKSDSLSQVLSWVPQKWFWDEDSCGSDALGNVSKKYRLWSEEVRLGMEEGQARVSYQSMFYQGCRWVHFIGELRRSHNLHSELCLSVPKRQEHLYSASLVISSWLPEAEMGVIVLTSSVCR